MPWQDLQDEVLEEFASAQGAAYGEDVWLEQASAARLWRQQRRAQEGAEKRTGGECAQTGCRAPARSSGAYCDACLTLRRERLQLREALALAEGRCRDCSQAVAPGCVRCEAHLKERADKIRAQRALKEIGLLKVLIEKYEASFQGARGE